VRKPSGQRSGAAGEADGDRPNSDILISRFLDAVPDVIGLQDAEHRVLLYNRAGCDLLGLTPEQVRGRRCFELIGRTAPCAECPVAEAVATGRPTRTRRFERALDRWFDVRAYPLPDPDGRVTRVIEHLRDITAEQRTAEFLRTSEARYRLLTENQRDIVVACDRGGTIIYCSPAVREFGGYDPDEAVGTSIMEYFDDPDDLPWIAGMMRRMVEEREPSAFELMYKPRSGPPFPVEISAKPLIDDGEVVGFHGIARDIRRRRAAEEARAALEERLAQADKMEAIGRLAGGVAHDFNNLLTAISGCAELALRKRAITGELRTDLERILECSRAAAELTGHLLAFSRKEVAVPRVIDVGAELKRVHALLSRLIRAGIELRIDVEQGLWPVLIDPAQFERVIVNLATNARDSIEGRGWIGFAVSNVSDEADGDRVRILIRDSGAGMDAETAGRVFEPFFTTKPVGRGTGLGLATVHGIIEQNGGAIRVETAPGAGTTFEIFLPRAAGPVEGVAAPDDRPQVTGAGAGEVVLVAEDEAVVRSLICRILVQGGYVAVPAGDGAEALRLAREAPAPPRLLLTDVVMPVMDGVELYRHLRREFPEVPVLFVSGYAEDVLARDGLLPPGVTLLQKPFTADALLAAVRTLLAAAPEEVLPCVPAAVGFRCGGWSRPSAAR